MNHMITWEFYSSLYNNISEEEFGAALAKAEAEAETVIGPIRWATITESTFGYERLQFCLCQIINQMQEDKKTGAGKGIASVSNDGYSETYAKATAEEAAASLHSQIKAWLSGTGLVRAY